MQLLEPALQSLLQELSWASGFHPSLPLVATHLRCAEEDREEGGDTQTSRSLPCQCPQLWDEVGLSHSRLWDKPCRCSLTPIVPSSPSKAHWAAQHPLHGAGGGGCNLQVWLVPCCFLQPSGPTSGAISSADKGQNQKKGRVISSQLF